MKSASGKYRFSIDRGGTFTDVFCTLPDGSSQIVKLLSEDPAHYNDAPTEAIRRLMGAKRAQDINTDDIEFIRMGTTVATNSLLERKGERTMLFITEGFGDLLRIGNQARPDLFNLSISRPDLVFDCVMEIPERVMLAKDTSDIAHLSSCGEVVGVTGERVVILEALTKEKLHALKESIIAARKERNIGSAAVVLLHGYTFPAHESMLGDFLRLECGFPYVTLSHDVMPMIRMVPRGLTTCVDAYLTPLIVRYVQNFARGFLPESVRDDPDEQGKFLRAANVSFMQSDGGLTKASDFRGSRAIFSGPAGGFVGYALTTRVSNTAKEVLGISSDVEAPSIGLDMGGTSTDCSRYAGSGSFEHVYEVETAGVVMQTPTLHIETVASGGGSRLFFRNGMFVVGPESAGAHPGPLCYRKNGHLAITDANLVLGRILPQYFPHIFGENGDLPLDLDAPHEAFEKMRAMHPEWLGDKTIQDIAAGFVDVANETMCRPIRNMTISKGYKTSSHVLAIFGGAGAQHACGIARKLAIKVIFVHRFAGILSAYGIGMASLVKEAQEPSSLRIPVGNTSHDSDVLAAQHMADRLRALAVRAKAGLPTARDVSAYSIEHFANVRFEGTDFAITTLVYVPAAENPISIPDLVQNFKAEYRRLYGFTFDNRSLLVDDLRVRVSLAADAVLSQQIQRCAPSECFPKPIAHTRTYFDGSFLATSVFNADALLAGHRITAPAIIVQNTSTILVEPGFEASVTDEGNIEILYLGSHVGDASTAERSQGGIREDPVMTSIFGHRFMSIAEEAGKLLRRSSISTNIKERLDFSCAVFGPDGQLVSNAPSIPVHLGSMQYCVAACIKLLGDDWHEGDVILTNHPAVGGTHLPDMTVVTAVFPEKNAGDSGSRQPMFYVAARGHHADIGGAVPGSMPPFSKKLSEEGVAVKAFKIVNRGEFDLDGTRKLFETSRNVADNLADLQAQCSANHRASQLLQELVREYGVSVVQAYCQFIQRAAERAVRDMLTTVVKQQRQRMAVVDDNVYEVNAFDFMDDGSRIACKMRIHLFPSASSGEYDVGKTHAVLDFTGSAPQVDGNWNAPIAICYSACIYVLRCLVHADIPLNSGCLVPITVIVPPHSILSPDEDRAVVAGNTLTSQRIVDVLLRAFGACAASQGCMNNFTFGNNRYGYYETICGGAGAGPTWNGASAVHTHMTNTRITDPEILEKRYPVLLRRFAIRHGSGGRGRHSGGDGTIREVEFLDPSGIQVSILSERRVYAPYGLAGGDDAACGENWMVSRDATRQKLGGKAHLFVGAGDRIIIMTPGGGGYGDA
jgi:5-oxoprolinase (ATP-hydrolysing)